MKITLVHKVAFSLLIFILAFAGIYLYQTINSSEAKAKGKESKSFLDGYNFRKKIIINNDQLCGKSNIKDFVFLFSKTDPDLRHTDNGGKVSHSSGFDISFTDKNGTKVIPYEIEEYDPVSGKLVAWVTIKQLKYKSDNELYLYYGNQGINTIDHDSPWNSDAKGIWHLGELVKNSIDNQSGTNNNTTVSNDGKIGKARYFNGTNAYIDFGKPSTLNINDKITVSAWAKHESGNGHLINMGGGWDDPGYSLFWLSNNIRIELQKRSPYEKTILDNPAPNDGKWHNIAFTWDKKSKTITTYIDGAAINKTGSFTGPMGDALENLNIGRKEQDGYYFKGFIDECRVLSEVLSEGQICTEYNNQNDPENFCIINEEEENECISSFTAGTITSSSSQINEGEFVVLNLTGQSSGIAVQWQSSLDNDNFTDIEGSTFSRINSPAINETTYFRVKADNGDCIKYSNTITVDINVRFLGLYGYRKKITIDQSMISGSDDLKDFPVLISTTDENLKSKENGGHVHRSNGYDIVFADKSGNFLKHDKEKYDPATGDLIAWVKIPKLSASEDQVFYLYYGNCDASTATNPSTYTTWPDDYRGIWHFDNNFLDATSNANNGTNVNSINIENGKIGNAQSFNGSNQYINCGANNSLEVTDAITISAWVYHKGGHGHIINKGGGWYEDGYSFFYLSNKLRIELQNTKSKEQTITDNPVSTGNWQYLTMTWDKKKKQVITYVNGVKGNVIYDFKGPIGTSNQNLNIGRNEKRGYYFNGYVDEPRIISNALSEDWIKTEYNNQNDPSGFIEISTEEREIAWVGGNSIDWNNPNNWCNCEIPGKGENIRIPTRINKPKLDKNREIGNLLIEEDASVNLNGFKLSVAGDMQLEGNFIHGNGELEFNGSAPQMVTSSNKIITSKLSINNTQANIPAITFNSDVSVLQELSLTKGIVNVVNGKSITVEDDAISNEGNPTSFVEGKVRKNGDDAFIFPIGKGGTWARIEITAPTEFSMFEAEYVNTPYHLREKKDVAVEKISPIEHWILDKVAGTGKVRVSLYWEDANRCGITDLKSLIVVKRDDIEDKWIGISQFTDPSGGIGEGVGGKVSGKELLDRFSPFTFGNSSSGSALPIELHSFSAQAIDGMVQLNWKTATEINNDYFTIERSTDNVNFSPTLEVKGAGNSTTMQSYQAFDKKPFTGVSYYRLKQTDYDGKFEYFDVKAVQIGVKTAVFEIAETYPNPFENIVTVNFNSEIEGGGEFHLISNSGKEIASIPITIQQGINEYSYQGNSLAPGLYLIYLTIDGNKTAVKKIIKK